MNTSTDSLIMSWKICYDAALESSRCIANAERHSPVSVCSKRAVNSSSSFLGSILSSIFIATNSSNSAKSSSSSGVPSIEKGLLKIKGTLLSSYISRITKSTGKVNLPTSTSILSAIPTG
ncbi:hypothetical protein Tco_0455191, partial [Tanacetum coccineum]